MIADKMQFEPMTPPSEPAAERRPNERDWGDRARTTDRREIIRNAILWITVGALALAVLTFLISVNSVISIWFRNQWAPVARSVAALAMIAVCLYVMLRLVKRDAMSPR